MLTIIAPTHIYITAAIAHAMDAAMLIAYADDAYAG